MGDEADYLSSNCEPDLWDYVNWGVIGQEQIGEKPNGIWGSKPYMKSVLEINLDKVKKGWLRAYIPDKDDKYPRIDVVLEGSIDETVKLNTILSLERMGFKYNHELTGYSVWVKEYQKDIRKVVSNLRKLDVTDLKVQIRISKNKANRDECRIKFNKAPLEKHKKRLRDLGFRYDGLKRIWICSRVNSKGFRDIIGYFERKENVQLV